jgi:DNA-binding IclR family transcriptional regulator
MPERADRTKGSTSFERSIDILLMFREVSDGVSARDIAEKFGVSRSSAFRYLQILRARDLVEPTAQPGVFRLGPAIVRLAQMRTSNRSLAEIADGPMRELAETTGESVLLTRRAGDAVVVLLSIDSARVIRVSIEAAQDSSLHVGSFGKLHLAYLPPDEIDRFLSRPLIHVVNEAPLDRKRLRAELEQIRNRGFAVSEGEVEVGMSSVSVPVLSTNGEIVAALSVAGPLFRLPQSMMPNLVRGLTEKSRRIAEEWEFERRFGGGPESAREAI